MRRYLRYTGLYTGTIYTARRALPSTEEEVQLLFHAHAHRRAVRLYQGQILLPLTPAAIP